MWTREREFHRPLDKPGRRSRQKRVAPLKTFRAECAADERADDPNVFGRQTETRRKDALKLFDAAGALVHEQPIGRFPLRRRRIGLDRVVIFDRRRIGRIDLMCCAGERAIDIATFNLQIFAANKFFGSSCSVGGALIGKIDYWRLRLISDSNKRSRVSGLLESFGDNNPEMLAGIMNFVVLQGHPVLTGRAFFRQVVRIRFETRRIFTRKDCDNARRRLRSRGVELNDMPVRDRALDQRAVGELGSLKLRGVGRSARYFESTVNTRERLSNCRRIHHAIPPRVVSARTIARLASSILNELCL